MNFCRLDIENDMWLKQATEQDWGQVIQKCTDATLEATGWAPQSEVSFLLTDDAIMQELNGQHRQKNETTNVLSFPLISFSRPTVPENECAPVLQNLDLQGFAPPVGGGFQAPTKNLDSQHNNNQRNISDVDDIARCMLGDVVLSYSTVLKESKALGRPFLDHVFHLMTHGVLHLLGYDHENDSEAFLMESLEILVLQRFEIPNPYV
ncbi:MAG: rRNA maturation RNase YbeY [Holosporales bacterium]|jgi:probable rRNA maturation factor|nr:rRNA maturation RNase YbeY [Holosporales bacterium]